MGLNFKSHRCQPQCHIVSQPSTTDTRIQRILETNQIGKTLLFKKLRIFLRATTTDYPYESIAYVGAIWNGCPTRYGSEQAPTIIGYNNGLDRVNIY